MHARATGKTYLYFAMSGALILAALATSRIELFMLATPIVFAPDQPADAPSASE